MADTISGHWDRPIVRSRKASIVLAIVFFSCSVIMFHDAYEVRGKDRPFLLKIVGYPQI
jgi:hypothetical protein